MAATEIKLVCESPERLRGSQLTFILNDMERFTGTVKWEFREKTDTYDVVGGVWSRVTNSNIIITYKIVKVGPRRFKVSTGKVVEYYNQV